MENKQEICDLLLPALQHTGSLQDVIALEYDSVQEVVTATYRNGYQKSIDVAADSGVAMIRDIMNYINR